MTPTGGGGYGENDRCNICRTACNQKRNSSRQIAEATMVGAVLGCGIAGSAAAEQIYTSTFLLNLLGPEAPATAAALGGIVVAGGCLTSALIIYRETLNIIESDYQISLSGCPCT